MWQHKGKHGFPTDPLILRFRYFLGSRRSLCSPGSAARLGLHGTNAGATFARGGYGVSRGRSGLSSRKSAYKRQRCVVPLGAISAQPPVFASLLPPAAGTVLNAGAVGRDASLKAVPGITGPLEAFEPQIGVQAPSAAGGIWQQNISEKVYL